MNNDEELKMNGNQGDHCCGGKCHTSERDDEEKFTEAAEAECCDSNSKECCNEPEVVEGEGVDKNSCGSKKTEQPVNSEEDFKSKYYYLAAEMDNMSKRFQREKEGIIKYSNEKLVGELLEIMDNFDRTISAINKDENEKIKNITVGVEMVRTQFLTTLGRFGVTPIKSLGEVFNPTFHEAVAEKEVAEEKNVKEQEIIEEYQKGYLLNGRVLRASKVVVAK